MKVLGVLSTIKKGLSLVKSITGQETPSVGKEIEKAGKSIQTATGGINVITIGALFGSGFTIEDFVSLFESNPVATSVICAIVVLVNVIPHFTASKYKAIGKSQTKSNPDETV